MSDATLVLIVDDFDDNRELFAEYLEIKGFRVLQASTGADAVDIALRELPAVVLMDVMLPDLDGWEATRRIKSDPRAAGVHVIALTGRPREEATAAAEAAGCTSLLMKPCLPDRVVAEIQRVLA